MERKTQLNEIIQRIEAAQIKKISKKNYFTPKTEQAVVEYNNSKDDFIKGRIYALYIDYPFHKIAENLINKNKFYHFEESYDVMKHEAVAHLVEKLPKYTQGKGKAFSYFTKVCLNFLLFENKKTYTKKITKVDLEVVDQERNVINEVLRDEYRESLSDFTKLFIKHMDTVMEKKFPNHNDYIAANAIIDLFRDIDNIEDFHKKALFIYIREQTDLKTLTITKVLKVIKEEYAKLFKRYNELQLNKPHYLRR